MVTVGGGAAPQKKGVLFLWEGEPGFKITVMLFYWEEDKEEANIADAKFI